MTFFFQSAPVVFFLLFVGAGLVLGGFALWQYVRVGRGAIWLVVLILSFLASAAGVTGLAFIGCAVGGAGVPEWSDSGSQKLEPLLRDRCVAFINDGKSVGLVAVAVRGDEVCVMGFGRPALLSTSGVTGETLFEIGSITKTFTGLLLAIEVLRDDGLRLDQPIRELLPSGTTLPEPAQAVTLGQLTSHSSGFPRLAEERKSSRLLAALGMMTYGADPYSGFTEQDLLRSLHRVKLENPPGQTMSYSNFGATTLGYLLAMRTGRDYEELVATEICRPLGMDETTINLSPAQAEKFASGYRALLRGGPLSFGLRSRPWTDARNLEGAGGVRSSGADMARYLLAQMRPANSPLAAAVQLSHRELFKSDDRNAVAMGWMLTRKKSLSSRLIWHNGGTGGFRSFLGFDEEGSCGVVVLSNSAESVDGLAVGILRELMKTPVQ